MNVPLVTRRQFVSMMGGAVSLAALKGSGREVPSSIVEGASDLASLTMTEASSMLHEGKVTATALVQSCLGRIAAEGAKANAFITITGEQALAEARLLDAEAAANKFRSPLHGIPIALKDCIDTAGIRTTSASAVFADRVPGEDAEVVRSLRAAGAIVIGKTNLGELSMDATSASSYYGPVRNPWALDRVTGGSSGGSGAALAAKCCYGTLGMDSGGSVRIPAAYCGVVGLKTTYGLVSMRGIQSSGPCCDTCGPMARSVEDVALLLDAMSGYGPLTLAGSDQPRIDYRTFMNQPVSGLRVGIPRKLYFDDLDSEIEQSIAAALTVLGSLVQSMRDVSLPATEGVIDKTVWVEFRAYHRRMQRQGYAELYRKHRPDYLFEDSSLTVEKSREALENYIADRADLDQFRCASDQVFSDFDVVAVPTMKYMPPLIDDVLAHGATGPRGHTLWENTTSFNVLGWPAISVPCGFSSCGLPIGLMIAGPKFSEGKLLALAHAFEQRRLGCSMGS